ncbi:MAG TPA: SET domain-containing protein [Candidatus Paceibacterota bacterium]|nr:SET domain-containing protein [Candidatus Paceibacterota bacterium]
MSSNLTPSAVYLVSTGIKPSGINGRGVFTLQKITKGEVVWKFDPAHDKTLSADEFENLDQESKEHLKRVAYRSPSTGRYVYPPENDPARFTNHSKDNNLSAVFDPVFSEEPYFISNRDIEIGEELTNNYTEFDEALKERRPKWI